MDDETLAILRSIDRRLALLTGSQELALRKVLRAEVLTTPARVVMWDAIDGKTGNPELAKSAKVSERAAQLFTRDLLGAGLVKVVPNARGNVVEKDGDAVVQWYMQRLLAAE